MCVTKHGGRLVTMGLRGSEPERRKMSGESPVTVTARLGEDRRLEAEVT